MVFLMVSIRGGSKETVCPTRNDFAALTRFKTRKDGALAVGGVHTGLDALLQHGGGSARSKMVWELLDTPLV